MSPHTNRRIRYTRFNHYDPERLHHTDSDRYLKLLNHVPKEDVHFIVPEDGGLFDEPWRDSPGTTMCDFDELLAESDIEVFSEEDIMARIKRVFEQNSGADDKSSVAKDP
jgi:hypothetical protein